MPYTDSGLPFSGAVPQSRHTSLAGATHAAPRAISQVVRLILALRDAPEGLTDWEASERIGCRNTSVCARRAELVQAGLIYAEGTRPGPEGIANAVWRWKR